MERDGNRWSDSSVGDATLNGGAVGMSGQLWSETIRTDAQLEYMAYPRILALAERAWHKANWELNYVQGRVYDATTSYVNQAALANDWNTFANVLGQKILGKLDKASIDYHIPVPGAKIDGGFLVANIVFPGLGIQYQDNHGNWQTYDDQNPSSSAIAVRGVSADGSRVGRAVAVQ